MYEFFSRKVCIHSKYYENIFDLQFTVEYDSIFYLQIYKFSTFGPYWKKIS